MGEGTRAEPRRILLVDDNEALRMTTAALLEDAGYLVVETDSVAGARLRLGEGSYVAAVLDVHLGDGSGLDLLDVVRRLQPGAVVVLLSGTAAPGDLVGADLALTKGMPPDEMLRRLEAAIASR